MTSPGNIPKSIQFNSGLNKFASDQRKHKTFETQESTSIAAMQAHEHTTRTLLR